MTRLVRLPAFLPWALLVVLTGVSWWLGDGHGPARFATVAVLLVAFFKVGTVGAHFMELRKAPLALELIFNAWCVLVCAVLIVLYLGS
ncbi:cytochrome C oxidase subunit IV family protein [Mycobacterium florentinum]|uniref:cytochrome C oxidase subunit IV family protein n=1 Tax=Mycobacterium florentinum TaxID=292462 RepID=UPI00146FC2F3|nr:cytochrome C oxidase subunit IV family protein [Mycobacterium florentinum]MCV7410666.1 cytochrome C oxidase subunit IV family protein [Mycobacterium florentinum]